MLAESLRCGGLSKWFEAIEHLDGVTLYLVGEFGSEGVPKGLYAAAGLEESSRNRFRKQGRGRKIT